MLTLVLAIMLLLAAIVYFGGRRYETTVTFRPVRYALGAEWTPPAGAEDVWFRASDNTRLHGWFVPARKETPVRPDGSALTASPFRPALATVLYFHGNRGNIASYAWIAERLAMHNLNVLVFDYRGYGRSMGKIKDERALYADADAAYEYLVRERRTPPEKLVLYGQSLGTTAAVDLAARTVCGALILESGLSSAKAMAGALLPWLPGRLRHLGRNRFDSIGKIPRVRCPVLITHGDLDPLIPIAQGRALYAAALEPKKLMIVSGADHHVVKFGGGDYLDSIAEFIREKMPA